MFKKTGRTGTGNKIYSLSGVLFSLIALFGTGHFSENVNAQCNWTKEVPQKHHTTLHALSITETICHDDIMILYDNTIGFPFASYAIHTQTQMNMLQGGRKSFEQDPLVSPYKQHLVNDTIFHYPYSRGHLTPSYIMSYNKTLGGSWEQTYYITNILPQIASFNEGSWEKFEMNIVDMLSKQSNDTTWEIYTGGFWNGKYSVYPLNPRTQNDNVKDYLFWKAFCIRDICSSGMITAFNHENKITWNLHSVNDLIPGLFVDCCPNKFDHDFWKNLLNNINKFDQETEDIDIYKIIN